MILIDSIFDKYLQNQFKKLIQDC